MDYMEKVGSNLRSTFEKFTKKNQSNKQIKNIYLLCANSFKDWQMKVLAILHKYYKIQVETKEN